MKTLCPIYTDQLGRRKRSKAAVGRESSPLALGRWLHLVAPEGDILLLFIHPTMMHIYGSADGGSLGCECPAQSRTWTYYFDRPDSTMADRLSGMRRVEWTPNATDRIISTYSEKVISSATMSFKTR